MKSTATPTATPNKNNNNHKGGKVDEKQTPKKTKTPSSGISSAAAGSKSAVKKGPDSDSHFCSSAFLNSPDPSTLPLPIFDGDNDDNGVVMTTPTTGNKTNALRQFLNIRSGPSSPATPVKI